MAKLTIIGIPQSTYVRVVRIVAEEKGIDYEHIAAALHSPEVSAIHPLGKVPVMRHGDVALAESNAIVGYIDRVFPGPKLIPEDPIGAAKVEQWVSLVNTALDRQLIRQYLFAYLFPAGADGKPDRAAIDAMLPEVQKHLDILAAGVAANGHLVGDSFSYADANIVPILAYLRNTPEAGQMIARSAPLSGFIARHFGRPSVVRTMPPAN